MNDVRFPIKTTRDGNKITKVCVEDVYKMMNRIIDVLDDNYNKSLEVVNSRDVKDDDGRTLSLITGTGISQPCFTDAFDEEIGNNIAFMKAKLNANIKKANIIRRILNIFVKSENKLFDELDKIVDKIYMDIEGIRKHNPEYLAGKF